MAVRATGLPSVPMLCTSAPSSEIHSGTDEAAERSRECKGSRTNRSGVLLGQPQAEHGEITAEEPENKQQGDKRMESVRQIEGPTKGERIVLPMPAK